MIHYFQIKQKDKSLVAQYFPKIEIENKNENKNVQQAKHILGDRYLYDIKKINIYVLGQVIFVL